jgi:hypothetical protein
MKVNCWTRKFKYFGSDYSLNLLCVYLDNSVLIWAGCEDSLDGLNLLMKSNVNQAISSSCLLGADSCGAGSLSDSIGAKLHRKWPALKQTYVSINLPSDECRLEAEEFILASLTEVIQ